MSQRTRRLARRDARQRLKMPWPKPCHPCEPGLNGHALTLRADGPYWHTASWDRRTGEWQAQCCRGHRKAGVAEGEP